MSAQSLPCFFPRWSQPHFELPRNLLSKVCTDDVIDEQMRIGWIIDIILENNKAVLVLT